MAENEDSQNRDDLSDEASPHKVEQFRRKGRVSQSRELSSLFAFGAAATTLYALSPRFGTELTQYMTDIFTMEFWGRVDLTSRDVIFKVFAKAATTIGAVGIPIAIAGFVFGFLGSYIQIGSIFSTEPLNPDINRINPIKGFQKYLTLKQLYDALRLIFKGGVVATVAYYLIDSRVEISPAYIFADPSLLLPAFSDASLKIFIAMGVVLLFFSAFDFWLQKWEYGKNVRVTKKEAREEQKEHEGDPLIKARVRSIQREISKRRMMEAVKTADVVVTNPTHIAIALSYDQNNMDAPKVVAKGADLLAKKIKKIAGENNVPTVENVPLARTLYKSVKIGQSIPRNLYQAVAEVLAYVYKLKNRVMG